MRRRAEEEKEGGDDAENIEVEENEEASSEGRSVMQHD